MYNAIAKISIFIGLLSVFSPVTAGRVDNLYDVEILVADESVGTREQMFTRGLDEVFVRISGDSKVMKKLKRPSSSRYVKQFSYSPVDEPEVNDKDELLTHRLNILYNGHAMEKYLLDNGFPAWGEYRTDVVIWLVVRDGKNEYVLKDVDQSLLKTSMVDAMTRRGVPDVWPAYDKKDKKILSVSEIRGGFKEPIMKASQRYSRGPALAGSMIWNGKQWQSSWNLLLNDEGRGGESLDGKNLDGKRQDAKSRHWSLNGTDHSHLINQSIDKAADALGAVFAVHTLNNEAHINVWLDIQAVNTIEDYRYAEDYLAGLSAVEKVKPAKVDGETVVFEVILRSTEEEFLNLIKHDAELTKVEPPVEQPVVLPAKANTPDTKAHNKPQGAAASITPLLKTSAVESTSSAPTLPESAQASVQASAEQKGAQVAGAADTVVEGAAGQTLSDQPINAKATEPSSEPDFPEPKQVYYYRLNRSR
jgi:hypothetical protein